MRPTERSQAIAFLLSFGAIPLGCPAEDDGDDTNASSASGSNSNSSTVSTSAGTDSAGTDSDASNTNPNPTFPMTDPSASSTMTTDPSDPSDPSDPTASTDPDTGYGTYGSGGNPCEGIAVPQICTTYAAHYVKCFPKYADDQAGIAEYCACLSYYAPMDGPNCVSAVEDFFACLTALACENMDKQACAAESAALVKACPGGGGG